MIRVPDAASVAATGHASVVLGRRVGGSTGTNAVGRVRHRRRDAGGGGIGSVVTLLCDGGDRYAGTYFDDAWVREQGLDLAPYADALALFLRSGSAGRGSIFSRGVTGSMLGCRPAERLGHFDDRRADPVYDLGGPRPSRAPRGHAQRRARGRRPRSPAPYCHSHSGTIVLHFHSFIRLSCSISLPRRPG